MTFLLLVKAAFGLFPNLGLRYLSTGTRSIFLCLCYICPFEHNCVSVLHIFAGNLYLRLFSVEASVIL